MPSTLCTRIPEHFPADIIKFTVVGLMMKDGCDMVCIVRYDIHDDILKLQNIPKDTKKMDAQTYKQMNEHHLVCLLC